MARRTDEDTDRKDIRPDELEMMIGLHMIQEDRENPKPSRGTRNADSAASTLAAILCVIGGIFLEGFVFTLLGIQPSKVPVILILILWFVFAIVIMIVALSISSRKK